MRSEKEVIEVAIKNLVAKHAYKFNRAVVMRDKKKDYKRSSKHRNNNYE